MLCATRSVYNTRCCVVVGACVEFSEPTTETARVMRTVVLVVDISVRAASNRPNMPVCKRSARALACARARERGCASVFVHTYACIHVRVRVRVIGGVCTFCVHVGDECVCFA